MKIKKGESINPGAFWELKTKMDKNKKKETAANGLNEKAEIENTKEGTGKILQKFYTNLFKMDEIVNTVEEREATIMENKLYKSIKTIEKNENKP